MKNNMKEQKCRDCLILFEFQPIVKYSEDGSY